MIPEKILAYFSFTKKERTGVIVLIALVIVVFILPYFIPAPHPAADPRVFAQFSSEIAGLRTRQRNDSPGHAAKSYYQRETRAEDPPRIFKRSDDRQLQKHLFYFDPNTISTQQWKELGLRDRTIQTIVHYLARGGRFNGPEGLQKIYGLFPDEYQRLQPYVRIRQPGPATALKNDIALHKTESIPWARGYSTKKKAPGSAIDVNAADTAAWIALPGIGSKLAARIVSFREKLGGFFAISQVAETYALPDSTFANIKSFLKISDSAVRQIDVNTADENLLKQHPYIRWALAKAIVQYRNQHGPFKSAGDLQQLAMVTPDMLRKIGPYLKM